MAQPVKIQVSIDTTALAGSVCGGRNETMAEANSKNGSSRFRWKVFAAGIVSIIVGYAFLAGSDITFAPLLLVLGYCVLVPLSFL